MKRKKCTFDVLQGVGMDVEGYGKDDIISSCNCIGSEKVKGKGYFLNSVIKSTNEVGKGIAEVCGGLVIGAGTVALCILVPPLAEILLPIGGGAAIGVATEGIKTVAGSKEASYYGQLRNKLPSCIKKSWEGTKSVNLDWNGLSDITELEGLQNLEKISVRFNNLNKLPDLNKIPKLKSIDLSYSRLVPFTCNGMNWDYLGKIGKKDIDEIRECQASGEFKQEKQLWRE